MKSGDISDHGSATQEQQDQAVTVPPLIAIGDQHVTLEQLSLPSIQGLLWSLRRRQLYPRCTCVQPHRQLQLRRLGDTLHLAVWPGDGASHAHDCMFYRTRELEERIRLLSTRVTENAETGAWSVCLGASSGNGYVSTWPKPRTVESEWQFARRAGLRNERAPRPQAINLDGWLTWLWHESRLSQWQAHWQRDWGRVVWELDRLLAHGRIDRVDASELVLVVPPYRGPSTADTAVDKLPHARRELWLSRLRRDELQQPELYGLLIGEIKEIDVRPRYVRLQIRHFLRPLFVNIETWNQAQLSQPAGAQLPDFTRRVICGRVGMTERGNLRVENLTLLWCDQHYVPLQSAITHSAPGPVNDSIAAHPRN